MNSNQPNTKKRDSSNRSIPLGTAHEREEAGTEALKEDERKGVAPLS